jgi:hypothetical protein
VNEEVADELEEQPIPFLDHMGIAAPLTSTRPFRISCRHSCTPKRTGVQAPWQHGIAERWLGGCCRELLGSVIPRKKDLSLRDRL